MPLVTLPEIEAIQEAGKIGINHLEAKVKEKASKKKASTEKASTEKAIPHGGHQEIHQDTAVKVKTKVRKAKVRAKAKEKAKVTLLQVQLDLGTLMEAVKPNYVSNT